MENTTKFIKKNVLIFVLFFAILSYSQTTATYDFSFTSIWNATDHTSIPSGAHWSDLVGATHKNANEFLELGVNATTGIKNVAEFGNNTEFNNEVNAAIIATTANQWLIKSFSPSAAISSATLNDIQVTEEHHFLTLVSMIAPSPDWFISINSLDLRTVANDNWKTSFTLDVFAYDAGTDNGVNYDSSNSPNSPVGISMINGVPINGNKMGTLTVTLKSVLNVNEAKLSEVKIFPNPTKGNITINNLQNINLESIEVYNILGLLVSKINIEDNSNTRNLNFEALESGVYLLTFNTSEGVIKTRKLIIN